MAPETQYRWAALVAVVGLAACLPSPVPISYVRTPEIVGRMNAGRPDRLQGMRVAVGTSRERCAEPLASALIDEDGRFALPKTAKRYFLLSLMENFGIGSYWVCVGPYQPDGPDEYVVSAGVLGYLHAGDRLDCRTWEWRAHTQMDCHASPLSDRGYQYLADPDPMYTTGDARIVVTPFLETPTQDPPVQLLVRWMDGPRDDEEGETTLAVAELPVDPELLDLRGYPRFELVRGRWEMSVATIYDSFWSGTKRITFAIGEPGELTLISEMPES